MTYPKNIIDQIVVLQSRGYSAEKTVAYFKKFQNFKIDINTVYKYRKTSYGKEVFSALVEAQMADIHRTGTQNETKDNVDYDLELSMKAREGLIKALGQQILDREINQQNNTQINNFNQTIVKQLHMWRPGDEPSDANGNSSGNSIVPVSAVP